MVYKANPASVPRSERIIRRANCLAGDVLGQCVKIGATRIGNLWQVTGVTSATITTLVPATGVIIKKLSPTICFVQFHGTVPRNIYTGLTSGRIYVVGTDGLPATSGDANYPVPGGSDAFQQIGIATSSDELFVQPIGGVEGEPGPSGSRFFRQVLTGAIDGLNVVFTTALKFTASGPAKESVKYNGVELESGAGNDYVASESGGPATGFDTITLAFTPIPGDKLVIDFVPTS